MQHKIRFNPHWPLKSQSCGWVGQVGRPVKKIAKSSNCKHFCSWITWMTAEPEVHICWGRHLHVAQQIERTFPLTNNIIKRIDVHLQYGFLRDVSMAKFRSVPQKVIPLFSQNMSFIILSRIIWTTPPSCYSSSLSSFSPGQSWQFDWLLQKGLKSLDSETVHFCTQLRTQFLQ